MDTEQRQDQVLTVLTARSVDRADFPLTCGSSTGGCQIDRARYADGREEGSLPVAAIGIGCSG